MQSTKKRILALLLTLTLLLGTVPVTALAAEGEDVKAELSVEPIPEGLFEEEPVPGEPAQEELVPTEPAPEEQDELPLSELMLAGSAPASGDCGDNLSWALNEETGVLTITGTGAMWDYDDYADPAPWARRGVKNIVLGSGMTTIGQCAFCGCGSVTSVTIPEGVTTIGGYAFWFDGGLTSVTIPEGVTTIGERAFESCDALTDIYFEGNLGQWDAITKGEEAIPWDVTVHATPAGPCGDNLTWALDEETGVLTISGTGAMWDYRHPESDMPPVAPWHMLDVESAVIGAGVTSIGKYAFTNCGDLTSVTIPEGVTAISDGAFWGCDELPSVALPVSLKSIGQKTFYDCEALTDIYYGGTEEQWDAVTKGEAAIPDGVTIHVELPPISGECGENATCLLEKGVLTISGTGRIWGDEGDNAPWCGHSFTSLIIEEGITEIGCYAFDYCMDLKTVTIPLSVTSIEEYAFEGCENIDIYYAGTTKQWDAIEKGGGAVSASVTVHAAPAGDCGDDVEWLLDEKTGTLTVSGTGDMYDYWGGAPWNGYDVINVVVEEGVSSIGDFAFCDNVKLRSVSLPKSLRSVGICAFAGCEGLESITIPEGVTTIGNSAFACCYDLTSVTLPKSLTTLGEDVFEDCYSLSDVFFSGSEAQWSAATAESYGFPAWITVHCNYVPGPCDAGHNWGTPTYVWSADKSECTATRVCLNDAAHTETAIAEVRAYTTDAGCETTGETEYEADFDAEWAEDQSCTETLPALGHNWVFERVDDSSVPYNNVFYCDNCREEEREEIPTPKATNVILDCEAEETVYLNDMIVPCLELHAAVFPGNAMPGLEEQVKWSGMNTAYGTFEQAGNTLFITELTGKTGTITLTATAQDGSKVKNSVKLTFAKRAESIEILDSKGAEIEEPFELTGKTSYTFKTSIAADKSITDKNVLWELDSEYATVDAKTGKVTVKSFAGEEITACLTVATAADDNICDEIELRLKPNLTQSIDITNYGERVNDLTLPVDIDEMAVFLYAEPVGLEGDVKWSSSSSKIATVDDGTVYLKGTGTVTITAAVGKVKSSVKLSVRRSVRTITVPEYIFLTAGKSATLTATVEPANATNKNLIWELEEGAEVYATLSKNKITASKNLTSPVEVYVFVSSADGCAENDVPVILMPAASAVKINGVPPEGEVDYTDNVKLTAEIEPLSALQSVNWTSSNKSYTIDENGYITMADNAKSATVTFTATAADGSGKKATAKIKFVRAMRDEDLTLAEVAGVGSGKSVTVPYTLDKAVTNQKLTWTLDDTTYATCKNNVVTAKKDLTEEHTVTLTATAQDGSGISKSCTVTIYPVASGVVIGEVPEGEVDFFDAPRLIATVEPESALQSVKWSSSNKSYAIDNYGNITVADDAKAATVTFTATAQDGSGKKATAKIKFVRLMRDEDLTLPEVVSVSAGKSVTVPYTLNKAVTNQKLTWTLEKTTDATNKNNVVTAKKDITAPQFGFLVATAQDGSGISKSCVVTIYPIATAVKIEGVPEGDVDFSEALTLSAVVEPANALPSVKWSSSNKSFAIDEYGNITVADNAKSATVTFTATAQDGSGKKATAKIKFVRRMRDEDLTLAGNAMVAAGKSVTVPYEVNKAVTNQKLTWTLVDDTYATCKNNVVTAKPGLTEFTFTVLTATAQDGSGVSKRCAVALYPITTAVKIYNDGEECTGKTIDFSGYAELDVEKEPDNAMGSWTAKSSSSAVQVSMEGNMLYAWIAEGKTLKPGTKVTVTVTAADGSGKSAKVILKAVEAR